jgi:hypothetical protein
VLGTIVLWPSISSPRRCARIMCVANIMSQLVSVICWYRHASFRGPVDAGMIHMSLLLPSNDAAAPQHKLKPQHNYS